MLSDSATTTDLPPASASLPGREGWLRKRGQHNTSFKWRWCVLDGAVLSYYRGGRTEPKSQLRGKINLSGAVVDVDLEVSPEVTITTCCRDYTIALPNGSAAQQQAWIVAILAAARLPPLRESPVQDAVAPAAASPSPEPSLTTGRTRLCSSSFLPSSAVALTEAASKVDTRHKANGRRSSSALHAPARTSLRTPAGNAAAASGLDVKEQQTQAFPGRALRVDGSSRLVPAPAPWPWNFRRDDSGRAPLRA